jgi:hypothetical protein
MLETKMDLIGSVEFGDWINCEAQRAKVLSKSHHDVDRMLANIRIESLETAKVLLIEFLTNQDEMIKRARR